MNLVQQKIYHVLVVLVLRREGEREAGRQAREAGRQMKRENVRDGDSEREREKRKNGIESETKINK